MIFAGEDPVQLPQPGIAGQQYRDRCVLVCRISFAFQDRVDGSHDYVHFGFRGCDCYLIYLDVDAVHRGNPT